MSKTKLVISCFYDSINSIPLGFSWTDTILKLFKNKYKITILLHGETLKYGLRSSIYKKKYGKSNPYKIFLKKMVKEGIRIVICEYCLKKDGYNNIQLLKIIKPIKFSVDYIAQAQLKGKIVIYDANLN